MNSRITIYCTALLALCACSTTPQGLQNADFSSISNPVTRKQAIKTAYSYVNLKWEATDANRLHGLDPNGQRVDTPDAAAASQLGTAMWWKPGTNYGMPYKWGGFDTPEDFLYRLKNQSPVYAGDYAAPQKIAGGDAAVSSYAAGIDCSGLVSRCWNLPRPYSTRELGALCEQLNDFSELQPGDIALKPGTHVILFDSWVDDNRSAFYAVEAGGVPHWKCYRYRISIKTLKRLGYTPHRYKNIR